MRYKKCTQDQVLPSTIITTQSGRPQSQRPRRGGLQPQNRRPLRHGGCLLNLQQRGGLQCQLNHPPGGARVNRLKNQAPLLLGGVSLGLLILWS